MLAYWAAPRPSKLSTFRWLLLIRRAKITLVVAVNRLETLSRELIVLRQLELPPLVSSVLVMVAISVVQRACRHVPKQLIALI